jgi:tRNA(fMet)-specific endonuclease VapC
LEGVGKTIGSLDLLIATHALSLDCTLATSDGGFDKIDSLKIEDWTK